jgi:hypothetical protein
MPDEDKEIGSPTVNRRTLLRRGGGVLAGAAALGAVNAANATSASADPGQPVIQGEPNNAQAAKTTLTSTNPDATYEVANAGSGAPVRLGSQSYGTNFSAALPGDLHNLEGDLHYTHIPESPSLVYTDWTANQFVPIIPARALDTRTAGGRSRIINPGGNIDSQGRLIGGRAIRINLADFVFFGLAIYGNVTVTQPTAAGYATMWPMGPRPAASTVNFVAGQTVANFAVCGIGWDGSFDDFVWIFALRTTHIILDITGLSVFHPAQVSLAEEAQAMAATADLAAVDVRRERAERAATRLRELRSKQ